MHLVDAEVRARTHTLETYALNPPSNPCVGWMLTRGRQTDRDPLEELRVAAEVPFAKVIPGYLTRGAEAAHDYVDAGTDFADKQRRRLIGFPYSARR